MATLLLTHPVCLEHDTGSHHPECADRLRIILRVLDGPAFADLLRDEAPHATMDQLLRAHPMHHIEHVMNAVPHGDRWHHLDPDTVLSSHSGEAALRAAGAVAAAVDAVAAGRADNAFCAVRPPGHHAEYDRAMGFCIFNNVAVGALHARAIHGLKRVAVVDFDVHHGNGTQHILGDDPDFFYASTHQQGAYPGTGHASETGPAGNVVNLLLPPGAGSPEFRAVFGERLLPALRAFGPDLLMISAGFDAHANDPLAQLRLVTDDYAWATRELMAVAQECCGGRLVSVLEGGYDLAALAASTMAHVRALMGR